MFMLPIQPMQQAQSLPRPHELSSPSMTTSLVITPSLPSSTAPSARPKLSLNTAQTRTFGKGSSLRLETLSAVSPTIINTFANAYEPQQTPAAAGSRPPRPRLSIDSSISNQQSESEDLLEPQDSRTPSSSSVDSASTVNSATIPYSISHVLNSILANSPLQPRITPRQMAGRPRFPAEKKVSFRTPLVEEITNTTYTVAHSDIESIDSGSTVSLSPDVTESEEESLSSSLTETESSEQTSPSASSHSTSEESQSFSLSTSSTNSSPPPSNRRLPHRLNRIRLRNKSPKAGQKRDSSSESDSDGCPETPVAGRRKKHRTWAWTLGDSPGQQPSSSEDTQSTTSADESTSTTTTFTSSSIASNTASDESS